MIQVDPMEIAEIINLDTRDPAYKRYISNKLADYIEKAEKSKYITNLEFDKKQFLERCGVEK